MSQDPDDETVAEPLEPGLDPEPPASPPPPPRTRPRRVYEPTPRLTGLLLILLAGFLVSNLIAFPIMWIDRTLVEDWQAGIEVAEERWEASHQRSQVVGWVQLGLMLACGVVFAMWIMHANRNAAALSGAPLRHSPGWSVAWYFIPIASLWKPFTAMREIWQRSTLGGEAAFRNGAGPRTLAIWWFLWLGTLTVSRLSTAMDKRAQRAETPEAWLTASSWNLAVPVLEVVLTVSAILLVRGIVRAQDGAHVAKIYE